MSNIPELGENHKGSVGVLGYDPDLCDGPNITTHEQQTWAGWELRTTRDLLVYEAMTLTCMTALISQTMSNKPELGENHKGSVGVFGND